MKAVRGKSMQKLGGRKFVMAALAMAAGVYAELHNQGRISPSLSGLLVALVGSFSMANVISTRHALAANMSQPVEGAPAEEEAPVEATPPAPPAASVPDVSGIQSQLNLMAETLQEVAKIAQAANNKAAVALQEKRGF